MEKSATGNSYDHAEQFHGGSEHEQRDAIKIGTAGFGQNACNSTNNNVARDNAKKTNSKQSFASLFKDNRVADESSMLKFIGPLEEDIEISSNEVDSVEKAFGYCLIGYVMGNLPSPYVVLNFLKWWVIKSFISHLIGSAFIALLR